MSKAAQSCFYPSGVEEGPGLVMNSHGHMLPLKLFKRRQLIFVARKPRKIMYGEIWTYARLELPT